MSKVLNRKVYVHNHKDNECPMEVGKVGVIVEVRGDDSNYDVTVQFHKATKHLFYVSELRYMNNKEVKL